MPKKMLVPRPATRSEYVLKYATKQAEKVYVDDSTVYLEQVHTAHPSETSSPVSAVPCSARCHAVSHCGSGRGRADRPDGRP
ncbi:hypothetical protein [Agilicoccus flavus]|uniref:hypothetical protein n=1 Tax=Agilicoccus flavus TaxID=2775968 RepID=UPI001CF70BC3|nr:hypothetical protein [Agilicoccus flavus]